jgi:hypothetical protein
MRTLTRDQMEQYLIDCLGYSIPDCDDMTTHEMRDLISEISDAEGWFK